MFKKIFLIFIGILIPLSIAFADERGLQVSWPPSPMNTVLASSSNLTVLTQYFYEWGIALGGLAAFIALLIAGFMYLTSVGDPQKMADARGRIVWALAGLVLLLAAWIILNTISPDLTSLSQLKFKPEGEVELPDGPSFSTTPCTSAKVIRVSNNASTTIGKNACKDYEDIPASTTIRTESTPGQCQGTLHFYEKKSCKDVDRVWTTPASTSAATTPADEVIKSIKLHVIEIK